MKIFITLFLANLSLLTGCNKLTPCDVYKKRFLNKQAYLVISDRGNNGNDLHLKGYNPITSQRAEYKGMDGLYIYLRNSIDVGDTLEKRINEPNFIVRKKRYNISIEYSCNGKSYDFIVPDTLRKTK
ncbi:hypothetical protein [Hymenobacter canadensis]|uniref:Lipoprotein n=1 Tax=Hymenobacter canadensis TaxID=2999067 RepID=A0ABY7LV54_9BACT|nr:hypothetical protein [Hymenobacter canadensis]WBA44256.1 hypothetical protein O3303_21510 [Hymenobacter canadensis]